MSTTTKVKKTASTVAKKANIAGKKVIETVKSNPKTVLYVVGGLLAIYAGYKIYQGIKNVGDGIKDDPDAGGGSIDNVPDLNTIPNGATITKLSAQIKAADILSAVDSVGSLNESEYMTVENALRGKYAKDYQLISSAFGRPLRTPFTGEESTWWMFGEELNLTQWLTIELDHDQKQRLHDAAPLIWPAP